MKKRSIIIAGHSTSLWIDDEFWDALKDISRGRKVTLAQLVSEVDKSRTGNLSAELRLYVLRHYRALAQKSEPGANTDRKDGTIAGAISD